MRRYQGLFFIIAMALTASGCTKTADPGQPASGPGDNQAQNTGAHEETKLAAEPAIPNTPEASVKVFLEAIRTGNDEKANSMLSAIAREKTAAMDYRLTPTASDNAKFTIDNVDYVGEDGARVAMTWTDIDDEGKPTSDRAAWVLRKEAEGWRVVGTAAFFFPGEDPVLLNFENPAEVKKKLEEVSNRMNRPQDAGDAENRQAEQKENSENAVRR